MNRNQAKIDHAVDWLLRQDEATRRKAIVQLLEHAIESEWVGVWDEQDRQELAQESGRPVKYYEAPYFRTCGEPLGE